MVAVGLAARCTRITSTDGRGGTPPMSPAVKEGSTKHRERVDDRNREGGGGLQEMLLA